MVSKCGVLVNDLYFSQLNFFIFKALNLLSYNNDKCAFTLFYNEPSPIFTVPLFPIMNFVEAYTFDGPIIATNLQTVYKLLSFPTCSDKLFYIWDLEWIRLQNKQYNMVADIYQNDKLTLIARSKDHKNIIEECWSVNIQHILDDFNVDQLKNIINRSTNGPDNT